jgi:molybdate transport system substrate-binding protein
MRHSAIFIDDRYVDAGWRGGLSVKLKILSGGAAHGLVQALRADFEAETGFSIEGDFGAVGGMKDRIVNGEGVDLIILTRAIIDDLAARGLVKANSIIDVGTVETGLAIRSGDTAPLVVDGVTLRDALSAADAIYFPDPSLATAGIHFASVLDRLGVREELRGRLRPHPNGATAMRAMAAATDRHPLGCTQATEIVNTPGVNLVGMLPAGFELATVYTVAVATGATNAEGAEELAARLTSEVNAQIRRNAGFSS